MSYEHDDLITAKAFPRRLFAIVNNPENHTIINWNDKGDHFIIYNPGEFVEKILTSKEFTSPNYASFIRQLNMYDFHKVKNRTREKADVFYNKYFIRDRPSLLQNIKRKNSHINEQSSIDNIEKIPTGNIKNNQVSKPNFKSIKKESVVVKKSSPKMLHNSYKSTKEVKVKKPENKFEFRSNLKRDYVNEIKVESPEEIKQNTFTNFYPLNNLETSKIDIKKESRESSKSSSGISSGISGNNNYLPTYNYNSLKKLIDKGDEKKNENDEKHPKKANKNLIHGLYTTFLKNVIF